MSKKTLLDLGEREILRTIIPRFVNGAGDDCAAVTFPGGIVVATTDPVPPPAAATIGKDDDPFWAGWLLVTINASDLAAAGAQPMAFLAALEFEPTRSVDDFERVLTGIRAGCDAAGLAYVGGNLREATRFSGVGVAIGHCNGYEPIRRTGAAPGDLVVSIGPGGIFWRDALRLLDGQQIGDPKASPVFQPRSQIGVMHKLAKEGLIQAGMDNSDGLLPTLSELALKNGLGIEIPIENLKVEGVDQGHVVGAARMWFGWGDWNVVVCVSPSKLSKLIDIVNQSGSAATPIGRVLAKPGPVYLRRGESLILAPRLESERFAKDSWMSAGIEGYINLLRSTALP